MPHLIAEYSSNVDAARGGPVDIDDLVRVLHEAAIASGVAAVDALRTRAVARDHVAIGDRHPDNMFVAVTLRLGAGRTGDEKRAALDALLGALDDLLGDAQRTMMLSVECQEIDPAFRVNKNNLRTVIAERAGSEEGRDGC